MARTELRIDFTRSASLRNTLILTNGICRFLAGIYRTKVFIEDIESYDSTLSYQFPDLLHV